MTRLIVLHVVYPLSMLLSIISELYMSILSYDMATIGLLAICACEGEL